MGDEARILIVCTGNICRSPFIERLLQHELEERWPGSGPGIIVRSAGTSGLEGSPMDPRSAAQLVTHGGDPSGFTARQITPAIIAEADLVLTATRVHRGKVALLWPKALRRVFTFRDFADLVAGIDRADVLAGINGPDPHVPDAVLTPPDPPGPASWVRAVTEKAATRRGQKAPLALDQADVVDPYGREDNMFVTMAQQIVESMPAVVRTLAP